MEMEMEIEHEREMRSERAFTRTADRLRLDSYETGRNGGWVAGYVGRLCYIYHCS